jgi:hypothetical protein
MTRVSVFFGLAVLALGLLAAPAAEAGCKRDCKDEIARCKKTCNMYPPGRMRQQCKTGCKKGIRAACRDSPQVCAGHAS